MRSLVGGKHTLSVARHRERSRGGPRRGQMASIYRRGCAGRGQWPTTTESDFFRVCRRPDRFPASVSHRDSKKGARAGFKNSEKFEEKRERQRERSGTRERGECAGGVRVLRKRTARVQQIRPGTDGCGTAAVLPNSVCQPLSPEFPFLAILENRYKSARVIRRPLRLLGFSPPSTSPF